MRFIVVNGNKTQCIGVYGTLAVAEFIFEKSRLANARNRPKFRAEHILTDDKWPTELQEEVTRRVQRHIDSLNQDAVTNIKTQMYFDTLPEEFIDKPS